MILVYRYDNVKISAAMISVAMIRVTMISAIFISYDNNSDKLFLSNMNILLILNMCALC